MLLSAYGVKRSQSELLEEIRSFYFDTALTGPTGVPSLLGFAAPHHVLFGTDHPYPPPQVLAQFAHDFEAYPRLRPGQLDEVDFGAAQVLFPHLKATAKAA